jgi:RNA polymerase sigma-70 factor (ECF subfamily)
MRSLSIDLCYSIYIVNRDIRPEIWEFRPGKTLYKQMTIPLDDLESQLRSRPAGDLQALEAIVQAYRAPLYRLALSILHDADEAEDSVQDAFVRAARALDRYQVGTNFKAWLYTIAVNTCRDYLRKRALRKALSHVWEAIQSLGLFVPGPEAAAIENESRIRLWDLVDQLEEKHRLVVILRLGQDLSIQEVGQILEINEKTVYSRLYEAYKQLRWKIQFSTEHASYWNEYLR